MNESKNNLEEVKQQYIKELDADYRYGVEKFDTQALYISSGALAISLTFIDNIVPISEAVYITLYYFALSFFVFAIIIGFASQFISSKLIKARIKKIDNNDFNIQSKDWIGFMNIAVMTTLVLGIILLVLFAIINMNVANNKDIQPKVKNVLIERTLNDSNSLLNRNEDVTYRIIYIDTNKTMALDMANNKEIIKNTLSVHKNQDKETVKKGMPVKEVPKALLDQLQSTCSTQDEASKPSRRTSTRSLSSKKNMNNSKNK